MITELVSSTAVEVLLLGMGVGGGIGGKFLIDRVRNGNSKNGNGNGKPKQCGSSFCPEHHDLTKSIADMKGDVKVVKNDIGWIVEIMKKNGNGSD